MMKECQIVLDLLPLYAENMVSEASREFVERHLQGCPDCAMKLEKVLEKLPIPMETEVSGLKKVKSSLRKRTVFPVLLSVFLALTLLAGLAVWAIVPVWIPAEDAIVAVERFEDGSVRVKAADCVSGIVSINNSFCFERQRLDWLYSESMKLYRERGEHWFNFNVEEGQSLWYSGKQTGDEDLLIWGDGDVPPDDGLDRYFDRTIQYLCVISGVVGAVLLCMGILLRRNRILKFAIYPGVLGICCALSSLFVTNGYLLSRVVRTGMVRYERLLQQLIAIGFMTVLSFLCYVFAEKTVKLFKK